MSTACMRFFLLFTHFVLTFLFSFFFKKKKKKKNIFQLNFPFLDKNLSCRKIGKSKREQKKKKTVHTEKNSNDKNSKCDISEPTKKKMKSTLKPFFFPLVASCRSWSSDSKWNSVRFPQKNVKKHFRKTFFTYFLLFANNNKFPFRFFFLSVKNKKCLHTKLYASLLNSVLNFAFAVQKKERFFSYLLDTRTLFFFFFFFWLKS